MEVGSGKSEVGRERRGNWPGESISHFPPSPSQTPTVLWDTSVPVNQSGHVVIDSSNNVYIRGTASDTTKSYVGVVKLNSSGQII